jgi:hypothetical protein
VENHLIRSGCCPKLKDRFYKTVKSTIKKGKNSPKASQFDEGEWKVG